MRKVFWTIIVIALLALAGWGIVRLAKEAGPQGPDYSIFYPVQNREHIEIGAEHPSYVSNPPASGWHYALTAKKRFYSEPVADEYMIHNLEHGDIWIAYRPTLPEEAKRALEKYAFTKVVVTSRENNPTDIALVAWERVDAFDLEGEMMPDGRIRDFIKRYRNKGPEQIPAGAQESTFN